ncbi:putative lysine decarboxylase [[Synechococcus] sp. NIES-970]|uniref:LOG family protein n=1 Tax=Picosynechococcus sp. NKBG15041c TaxID=1407650 RepID=UPI0004107DEA|nr:LOG family protein [Picosynechococcus sp. NKBG15041c]BAW96472.1 putative lysine decarboxylase [[Synechococcus] sp. NIES-970]
MKNQSNGKISSCFPVSLTEQGMSYDIVQEAVLSLWQVVNGLSSIQPPKRDRYRVTIFGSARITRDSPLYEDVRRLASELTLLGCDIVTGGGPGLMEAANEGSVLADPEDQTRSIGIRVDLGFEQEVNPFVEEVFQHQTFFSRLHHFVLVSDAFVVVPGGIGTALEALMIWQLLQVRSIHKTPFILVGDMWAELVDWAKAHMVPHMADAEDCEIPVCVPTVDEAIAHLKIAHGDWRQCEI